MLLGCIADDFTGATDLALMLSRNGLETVQTIGTPASGRMPDAEAVVVALKSRTIPAAEAVALSLEALRRLQDAGARQIFFKYCSTFDSTPAGNIGPVADALLDALDADFTIACPAFPANARTIYRGHLFVGDVLLSDSGMRNHPLTPMTDANLVRVLGRQTRHKVGMVPHTTVDAGAAAVRAAFDELRKAGFRHAIVDAISDEHLRTIGAACAGLALVTGGSGVAMGLPANLKRDVASAKTGALPRIDGSAAVIAGSCSEATLGQIAAMKERHPALAIDPLALGRDPVGEAIAWAKPKLAQGPVLIYASAAPDKVAQIHAKLGREESGALIERTLAAIAQGLVEAGVRRLVVAGGETSGAVVAKLGVTALRIGPEIAPGVPWTASTGQPPLLLALKSGNFGARDFFLKAFEVLA
jgi:3-dehydrotetronate 4-kinase